MQPNRRQVVSGVVGACICPVTAAFARPMAYKLNIHEVAPSVFVAFGEQSYFSLSNGGNISNVSFIDTDDGVVLIDSGSSRRYGEALKSAIRRLTRKDVIRVYNTHHHPDHFLGNQVFGADTIASTPGVIANIIRDGEGMTENLYRLVGDWMRGTEVVPPKKVLNVSQEKFGKHVFRFIELSGHTSSDLAILEETSGVLFAGDLVFYDRAPTTPHATLSEWLVALDQLANISHRLLVPGHGPVDKDGLAIAQTKDYLIWLKNSLEGAVQQGLTMNEAAELPIPAKFEKIAVLREERVRSIAHLYPEMEESFLPLVGKGG